MASALPQPRPANRAGASAAPLGAPLGPFVRWAALLVLAVGGCLYVPTFRCSYAYDDMDYLNFAATVLAGRQGYWSAVFHPHLEHLVPLVRIAFHASAAAFGVWALPFRLVVFLAHAGAGLFMALVARRYTGSNVGGWAAALAYMLPAGFSSVWIWLMTGAGVPLGLFGLTGALAALAWSEPLGRARAHWLAAAGLGLAAGAESTLVPLFLVAALVDEIERRRGRTAPPRRLLGPFSIGVLAGAVVAMAAASVLYRQVTHQLFVLDFKRGLPRALFLLTSAPFRYAFPGLPLSRPGEPPVLVPIHGCLLGLAAGAMVAVVLIILGRRFPAALVPVVGAAFTGPLGVLVLVGLGRAGATYTEIYEADRYYFTLLLPICLLAAGIATGLQAVAGNWSPWRRRALAAVLASALAAEAVLHLQALLARVPFAIFALHEQRFEKLARLDDALARAARRVPPGQPPPRLPDGSFFFPEVHNGRVSAALLLEVIGRGRTGIGLGRDEVGERDARLLNPAFDEWARTMGEPLPYFAISGGRLVDAHRHVMADFRLDAGDALVVSGFQPWLGGSRWMGERGVLQLNADMRGLSLRLGAPVNEISRRFPARPPLTVRVSITDQLSGINVPVDTLTVGPGDDDVTYRLDCLPFIRQFGAGRGVLLVLDAGPAWCPADLQPSSPDRRPVTIRVTAAAFVKR